ncbi:hypothetical protein FOZ60_000179 [Perkinsus olseni]|uniref:Uncharacterized protein n=1 Tax=Perkinsus olseni TaxID=32597 RepID=A0A7J6PK43_PEROL|nr:hypothetical protein FOZ60_000179 [Perkinsus olseni]
MSNETSADIEERGSLIRGIPLRSITSRWTLFRGSEGSDETYDLSKPVEELDMFLSHSWSGSPFWKHLTLISILYVKTGYIAMLATVIPLSVGIYFLPAHQRIAALVVQILGAIAFVLGICFGHLVPSRSNKRMVFLDKCCIPQNDSAARRQGIYNMDTFLRRSKQLLILWTPDYFSRLWCVFELASYLRTHDEKTARFRSVPHFRFYIFVTLCEFAILGAVGVLGEVLPSAASVWFTFTGELLLEVLASIALCFVILYFFVPAKSILAAQLSSLTVASAECSWTGDKRMLSSIIEGWYGSDQEFERSVRTTFSQSWSRQHILVVEALGLVASPYVNILFPQLAGVLSLYSVYHADPNVLPVYVYVRDILIVLILLACRTPLVLGLCFQVADFVRDRRLIALVVTAFCCIYHLVLYIFTRGIMFSLGDPGRSTFGVPEPCRWSSLVIAIIAVSLTYSVNFGCSRVFGCFRQFLC